jgi:hypothetical protein
MLKYVAIIFLNLVCRKSPENKEVLWSGGEILRFDLSRIVNDFIWKNTKTLTESKVDKGRKKELVISFVTEIKKILIIDLNMKLESRKEWTLFLSTYLKLNRTDALILAFTTDEYASFLGSQTDSRKKSRDWTGYSKA